MNFIKKLILGGFLAFYCLTPGAFAATSVLPQIDSGAGCDPSDPVGWAFWSSRFNDEDVLKAYMDAATKEDIEAILGCALKSGEIQFWMVPYYVVFALEFIIELAGLLVVLMIMVGAYYYIAGGITDDKEKGKTIIKYALGGFILVMSSWILVNIILLALTS